MIDLPSAEMMPSVTEGVLFEKASAFPSRERPLQLRLSKKPAKDTASKRGRPVHLDKCDVEAGSVPSRVAG